MTLSLSSATTQPQDAAALKTIEAARADPTHPLWSASDDERDRLYHAAFPGPLPPKGIPVKGDASAPPATPPTPSAPAPPGAPMSPAEARAKIDAIMRDPHSDYLNDRLLDQGRKDRAIAEMTQLHRLALGAENTPLLLLDAGRIRQAPDPNETKPVSVEDADLPPITLPEGVSPDDPVVRSVRQLGELAEVAPAAVEGLVAHVHNLLQTEPPDEDEYWRQSDAVVAAAERKYGARFPAFLQDMARGRTFVERHYPELKDILEDDMVQKDLRTAEILAHLGSQGRKLFVRKFGTKIVARI